MPSGQEWFRELYYSSFLQMLKVAATFLGDEERGKELVQESFLIFLMKRPDQKGHPNLPGWLMKTLMFLLSDEVSSARHRLEVPLPDYWEAGKEDTYHIPLTDLLPKGLTKRDREILILAFEEELKDEEIAKRLQISLGAGKMRLHRAKNKCKTLIKKDFLEKNKKDVTKQPLQPI